MTRNRNIWSFFFVELVLYFVLSTQFQIGRNTSADFRSQSLIVAIISFNLLTGEEKNSSLFPVAFLIRSWIVDLFLVHYDLYDIRVECGYRLQRTELFALVLCGVTYLFSSFWFRWLYFRIRALAYFVLYYAHEFHWILCCPTVCCNAK